MIASIENVTDASFGNRLRHNANRVLSPVALERWESDGGALPLPPDARLSSQASS